MVDYPERRTEVFLMQQTGKEGQAVGRLLFLLPNNLTLLVNSMSLLVFEFALFWSLVKDKATSVAC